MFCAGNQLDEWACAVVTAVDADADGICDDVDDCVGNPTSAASATVLARSTSADVLTSQKETINGNARRFGRVWQVWQRTTGGYNRIIATTQVMDPCVSTSMRHLQRKWRDLRVADVLTFQVNMEGLDGQLDTCLVNGSGADTHMADRGRRGRTPPPSPHLTSSQLQRLAPSTSADVLTEANCIDGSHLPKTIERHLGSEPDPT